MRETNRKKLLITADFVYIKNESLLLEVKVDIICGWWGVLVTARGMGGGVLECPRR